MIAPFPATLPVVDEQPGPAVSAPADHAREVLASAPDTGVQPPPEDNCTLRSDKVTPPDDCDGADVSASGASMLTIVSWHGQPDSGAVTTPPPTGIGPVGCGVCPPPSAPVSAIQNVITEPGWTPLTPLSRTRSAVALAGSWTGWTDGGDSSVASDAGDWPKKPGRQAATFAKRAGCTASSTVPFPAPLEISTTAALVAPGSIESTIAARSLPSGACTVSTPSAPVWAAATRSILRWPTA